MTAREMGLLLLCSSLGDAKRHPLTLQRLQELERAALQGPHPLNQLAQVEESYLRGLGFGAVVSCHIVRLLQQEEQAKAYLARAKAQGIACLTRLSPDYPRRLLETLGSEAPAVLWVKGDLALLQADCISVVGSREISSGGRKADCPAGLYPGDRRRAGRGSGGGAGLRRPGRQRDRGTARRNCGSAAAGAGGFMRGG